MCINQEWPTNKKIKKIASRSLQKAFFSSDSTIKQLILSTYEE
jgi:hypothetical protein